MSAPPKHSSISTNFQISRNNPGSPHPHFLLVFSDRLHINLILVRPYTVSHNSNEFKSIYQTSYCQILCLPPIYHSIIGLYSLSLSTVSLVCFKFLTSCFFLLSSLLLVTLYAWLFNQPFWLTRPFFNQPLHQVLAGTSDENAGWKMGTMLSLEVETDVKYADSFNLLYKKFRGGIIWWSENETSNAIMVYCKCNDYRFFL